MWASKRSCSESVISGIWVFMNWCADEHIFSKACMRCVDICSSLCISDCNTHIRFSERWRKGCSSELRDGGNETSEPGSAWQTYKLVVSNGGTKNEKKWKRNLHMVKAIMDSHVRDSAIPFVIRGHFNDRTQLGLSVYSSLCVCVCGVHARVCKQQVSFGARSMQRALLRT
jgi:hypothetical protein